MGRAMMFRAKRNSQLHQPPDNSQQAFLVRCRFELSVSEAAGSANKNNSD
jgi:hypothetical protein